MYKCSGCGNRFKTSGWLTRHHNTCKDRADLLEAGVGKFRMIHGTPQTPRDIVSKISSWASRHERARSSREQPVGRSGDAHAERDDGRGPSATSSPNVSMIDLPLPETTEESASCLCSLTVEENEQIEPPELPTSSVQRGTRNRRQTWKVRENQFAEDLHQEPPPMNTEIAPSMTADVAPPTSRPPSPQPPPHQPLREMLDRASM